MRRSRGHVEEMGLLFGAQQGGSVDRGALRHHLVGIDVGPGLLLEVVAHGLTDDGQARRAADQDDTVEVASREVGLLQRLVADLEGALHEVLYQGGKLAGGDRPLD